MFSRATGMARTFTGTLGRMSFGLMPGIFSQDYVVVSVILIDQDR